MASEVDWQELYRTLLPKVFHYFSYRVGDTQAAEDLTAITFERAWRHRGRYRKDLGKFQAWVFGIANKVFLEHLRSPKNDVSLDEVRLPGEGLVDAGTEARDDFERLSLLLGQIPDEDRQLLALKYGAELTNRAIAKLTRMSESNVGTRLHRLVLKLRSQWEQDYER